MDFGGRVRALREERGLTQEEVAKALGLTRPAVGRWETNRAKPRIDKLDQLAEILGTTPYYLLNGDGPARVESRPTSALVPMRSIGVTCMGSGHEDSADEVVEVPAGVAGRHPALFVVHGIGTCMDRRFPSDAALGVDPTMVPRTGDAVLVRDQGRGSYVHVYMAGSGGTVMLSADSYSEEYPDIVIGPDDPPVEVLGVVVWWQAYEDVVR
ncbi:MAG: helix-turn-helix domain-containing protein [Atopobiaceae bacterium]